jgi:putative flippase GtrA
VNAVTARSRSQPARGLLRDIRSPEWGIAGQGLRFAIAGTIVAAVYITVTTVLHGLLGVTFQIALVSGFTTGVIIHFTLQRVFVWRHYQKFALAIHHQALRYIGVCFIQYGLTALSTSQLPKTLGLPVEVVYLATAIGLAGLNFVLFRGRVFHPETAT